MLGTIVNVTGILIGAIIGSALKKKFKESTQEKMFIALGCCSFIIGGNCSLQAIAHNAPPIIMILSICFGGIIGDYLKLHERLVKATSGLSKKQDGFGQGLVTATLFYCIGALSIVGPMQSALQGDNTLLFTNASLDCLSTIALSATYGMGIGLAAVPLFLFQGFFYLLAIMLNGYLPDYILQNLLSCGGLIIIMSGLNLLKLKNIPTTDFLPSLLVAPLMAYIASFL